MALKDLLVYVDQTESAFVRLRLAVDLARRHTSRLIALYVREWSPAQLEERKTAELGLASAADCDRLDRSIEASIDEGAERLRSALEAFKREHGLEAEWLCLDGLASVVVPQHARYADLCILGQDVRADTDSVEYSFSEQLLFVTGRPVLFIPAFGSFETLGRHILVAWNSSRASARAVSDALPLIERAKQTTVITINPADFIGRHGALPAKQMVEHLRRHSASVEGIQLKNVPAGGIADALQAEAHKVGADLVVAGAFGHPKLWEKLLGGVTRDLLARMSLPILMSH
ncbi:MAG: universal stress protein [Methylocella sp.]